jgi:hypothetical protein
MSSALRILITGIAAVGTFFFTSIMGSVWFDVENNAWAVWVFTLSMTAGAAALVWRQSSVSGGFFTTTIKGAVVTGTIAFSAGFFGPMILAPQSNQGPLLGLFITGPAGFLIGAAGGAIYWTIRRFSRPAHS